MYYPSPAVRYVQPKGQGVRGQYSYGWSIVAEEA